MNSNAHHKMLIDASSPQGTGLCDVLARILQVAIPQDFGFSNVALVITASDKTDWPEVPWLEIIRSAETSSEGIVSFDSLQQHLAKQPRIVLVSLNTVRFKHERSVVFLNDSASSTFSQEAASAGGLLQRLKEKITARAELPQLDGASGIIGLSCYAIAQTAKLEKMQHLIPLGVIPDFFAPMREHRLVEDVAINNPFVWLTSTDPASSSIETAIAAVKILRDYGACVELKVLIPHPDEAHERGEEFTRSLEKKIKQLSFVDLIDIHKPQELAKHYREADGFIWGDRSDYSHAPLLRAMASGLPVIAPNAEMVKKHLGSKVRFFIHGDANDLANTLERSMADIHFRIIGSSRNHKRSMFYTFEKSAAELFRVIRAYAAADLDGTTSRERPGL
ncbi:MAG: hypothetical protein AB8G18_03705 [Gammaproteobacteria bacterium]